MIAIRAQILPPLCAILVLMGASHKAAGQVHMPFFDVEQDEKGYLHVSMGRDSVVVVLNERFEDFLLVRGDTVLALPPGEHRIDVVAKDTRPWRHTITVQPEDTTRWNIRLPHAHDPNLTYHAITTGNTLLVETDSDSNVYVDGEYVGRGTTSLARPPGEYTIRTVHEKAGSRTSTVRVVDIPAPRVAQASLYTKPDRWTLRRLSLIPGGGQLYQHQRVKGYAFICALGASIAATLYRHSHFRSLEDEYASLEQQYLDATTETEAFALGNQVERAYRSAREAAKVRDRLMGAVAAVYLASIIDAWIPPAGGFREKHEGAFSASPVLSPEHAGLHVTITF